MKFFFYIFSLLLLALVGTGISVGFYAVVLLIAR